MIVWRNFERKSWPGLIVLSPWAIPILIINGEGYRDILDLFLSVAFDYYYDKINHSNTILFEPEINKDLANK
jgi:hypothetical protein